MAQTVLITLTTAGLDTGPFNLYSDADGYVTPFETGVAKSALVAGYTSTVVPDAATIIRVDSTGVCTNFVDLTINIVPPATTTTTTTIACPGEFTLINSSSDLDISGMDIGGAAVVVTSGAFPSTPSTTIVGELSNVLTVPNVYAIDLISVTSSTVGQTITVVDSLGNSQTQTIPVGTNDIIFNGVDFNCLTTVQITCNTSTTTTTTTAPPATVSIDACGSQQADPSGNVVIYVYASVPVDTTLTVGVTWTAVDTSTVSGTVTILVGETCGTTTLVADPNETGANLEITSITPGSFGGQTYFENTETLSTVCTTCPIP